MARQEVINYVRAYKGQFPDEAIRQQLLKEGVPAGEIEEAFRAVSPPPAPSAPQAAPGVPVAPPVAPPVASPGSPPSAPAGRLTRLNLVVAAAVGTVVAVTTWLLLSPR